MEFSTSLRVFGFSKLSKGCSSHDHGNTVEGKDTWGVIAMTEVTFDLLPLGLLVQAHGYQAQFLLQLNIS